MKNRIRHIIAAAAVMGLVAGSARAGWKEKANSMLLSVYQSLLLPELDDTVSHDTPWNNESPPTSQVSVEAGGPLFAGGYAVITIVYTAGRGGIREGGGIRIAFEHGADWGRLQVKDPEEENYAVVSGPAGVQWEADANYWLGVCTLFELVVSEGSVREGDTVRIVLGARSGGAPGFQVTTVSEVPGAGRLRIFDDRSGAGHYYQMPDPPELVILPGLPDRLRVIARSWASKDEPLDAVIHVDDKFNNVVSSYHGWFVVSDLASGERLGDVWLRSANKGVARINGVLCRGPGIMRLRVSAVAGGLYAVSNPVECLADSEAPRVFFGSIHSHTLASDGLNTMEGASAYARDVSNLDFFSTTEHVIWPDWAYDPVLLRHVTSREGWEKAAAVMREFNAPGSFVTLLGFEWTTNTYGDKVVYFFDDRAPFREFPPDQPGLYRSIAGERATVITHTMMGISGVRGPRWEYCDTGFERVMEIASYHGVREYGGNAYAICPSDAKIPVFLTRDNLAEGVLKSGLKLGFVAGSDDHSGKPGAGNRGILSCSIDGLTGVRADKLDRESIFSALGNRAAYATTGARILLDFSVNGAGMGKEIRTAPGKARVIRAEVHGQGPLVSVSIIREDPRNPAKVFIFDPPALDPGVLEWTDKTSLDASTWYYVRVMQSDGQMAWSSPVWVDVR